MKSEYNLSNRPGAVGSVWVATEGDYSDYHILGIFATEEAAKAAVERPDRKSYYSTPSIEEWPLLASLERVPYLALYCTTPAWGEPMHEPWQVEETSDLLWPGAYNDYPFRKSVGDRSIRVSGTEVEKVKKVFYDLVAQGKAIEQGLADGTLRPI